MVFKAADRVQEVSATVGTGPYVVTGAPTSFQTWLAGLGNGNSAYYAAIDDTRWEIGETVLTGGNTLSRNVIVSSNSNALVDWPAGAKKVFLDYPAVRAVFVTPTGKLNVDVGTLTGTMAQFDAACSDGDFVYQNQNANLGAVINTGAGVSTGDARIELGALRTGDGNSYIDFHSVSGSDNDARLLRAAGVDGGFGISNNGLGTFGLTQVGAAPLVFSTTSLERMRITPTGNVGIGTTTPGKRLSLSGGGFSFDEAGGAVRAVHWGDGVNYPVTINGDAVAGTLAFATAAAGTALGTERMRITPTGSVGIGNTAPVAKLHVTIPDGSYALGLNAATKGMRFIIGPNGSTIQGVDNTLVATYQPLSIGGSEVNLQVNGVVRLNCTPTGEVQVNGAFYNFSGVSVLDAPVNQGKYEYYRSAGVDRWVGGVDSGVESGGNAGANWFLNRYADNGAFLGTPLSINRANGLVSTDRLAVNGSEIWVNSVGTGLLLQNIAGSGSFIRSYTNNLWLGYGNNNTVNITSAGLTLNTGQFIGTQTGNQMLLSNGTGYTYTTIFRNDGNTFYILLSDPNTGPTNTWNGLRPFSINLGNGAVSMANGLTVNTNFVVGSEATFQNTINASDYLNMTDRNNDLDVNIRFLDAAGTTYRGLVGFQGSTDLRLWANTGWVRSVSNFVAPYIQSDGGIGSSGLVSSVSTGLSAGFRAVNNNIGHDYRFVAKDPGQLAITNESIGVEYISFQTSGNINVNRATWFGTDLNGTDIYLSGWHRNTGNTGLYNNTYGRGWTVPDGMGSSYGHMSVYGTGLNGWGGVALSNNNRTHLMNDAGNQVGIYDATQPKWLWYSDYAGNFTASGNVAAYSDLRLKENVREIDNLIQRRDTLALAAIKYERDGRTRIGYGAQTLRDNGCGEFVQEADDAMKIATGVGTLSVNYGDTTAVLAAASKLTDDRVAQLEAEVAELKALVATLVGR